MVFLSICAVFPGNTLAFGLNLVFGAPAVIIGAGAGFKVALLLMSRLENQRLRQRWVWISYLIFLSAILLSGFGVNSYITYDHPPHDAELVANFQRKQALFDQLAQMAMADRKLDRVADDYTEPDSPDEIGVSAETIKLYRELARRAGVPDGFMRIDSGNVEFMYWGIGSTVDDDLEKGYAYLTSPPKKVSESLDGYQLAGEKRLEFYRPIEGRWYLYLRFTPNE